MKPGHKVIVPSERAKRLARVILRKFGFREPQDADVQQVARKIANEYEQFSLNVTNLDDDAGKYVSDLDQDCSNAHELFKRALATAALKTHHNLK